MVAENEMAARRSFNRSMGKFEPKSVVKAVAILTAWRGTLLDSSGQPYPEQEKRRLNDEANERLKANILRRGFSHYPVVGAGEEQVENGRIKVNKENSLVIQAVGQMTDEIFIKHVQNLLFNPTDELGAGPFQHSQWGALVKFPRNPQAFVLHYDGNSPPTGPESYVKMTPKGESAEPRRKKEPEYTQMKYGPRADSDMIDDFDHPDDVGNIDGKPGKRFRIKNGEQP